MKNKLSNKLILENGASIAVVGGGPSGSFFSYFAMEMADKTGLEINIDIFEAKDFSCGGPAGCNHCGGIISESLIQLLSAEGIDLPSSVVKRGIESYALHTEVGSTLIEAPFSDQKIAALFRGSGPMGCMTTENCSFDNHLLSLCKAKGANVIYDRVLDSRRSENGIIIHTKNGIEKEYDLLVGAVGLNKRTFDLLHTLCPEFVAPRTTKTYITEIELPEELITEYFGNSMHVFLLNLPNIKFGALIPKQKYVTLVILGSDVDMDLVQQFIQSDAVKRCFPPGFEIDNALACQCFPDINVKGAKLAHSDRVVLIGDSSTSKLYKNGIGAAYLTAKAAATTCIINGISAEHFQKYFQPACRTLQKDNRLGRLIFAVTSIIQRSSILKAAVLRIVIKEQKKEKRKRYMSTMLWDTFTGSAPYNSIFYRFLHPMVIVSFFWYTFVLFITRKKSD